MTLDCLGGCAEKLRYGDHALCIVTSSLGDLDFKPSLRRINFAIEHAAVQNACVGSRIEAQRGPTS
ncbi:MAG: hypothetical protein C4318_02235 [Acidimicrobiia bacterium]